MKNPTRVAAMAGLLLVLGCSAERATDEFADVVYTSGRIYTVDEAQPWAEAVAIKDGKFLVVGSNADVEAVTGDDTEITDLEGRFAMPGLIDSHNHALGAAEGWANLRISDPTDAAAILEDVRAYSEANPDLPVIRGEAWNLGVFPNNSPRKELLDEIVPDRPVYLISQTGHSAWANSNALELA
ncbi:MAG: amidohydrolase family protein, partial [Gemmatimonadota bacterium]